MNKTAKSLFVTGASLFSLAGFTLFGGVGAAMAAPAAHTHMVQAPTKNAVHHSSPTLSHLSSLRKSNSVKSNTTISGCYSIPTGLFAGETAAFFNVANIGPGYFNVSKCDIGVYVGPGFATTINGATIDGYHDTAFGAVVEGGKLTVVTSTIECNYVDGILAFPATTHSASVAVRQDSTLQYNGSSEEWFGGNGADIEDGATLTFDSSQAIYNYNDGIYATLSKVTVSEAQPNLTELNDNGGDGLENSGGTTTVTGSHADGNSYDGIEGWAGATTTAIGTAALNNDDGFENNSYSAMTLTNVTADNNYYEGVYSDQTSTLNSTAGSFAFNGDGFYVEGAATITNANIVGNCDGIYIDGTSNGPFRVNVTGGTITLNGDDGIYADTYAGVVVLSRVTVVNNSDDGVDAIDGTLMTASYVTSSFNGYDGFYVDSYSTLNLSNSTAINNFNADVEFTGVFNNLGGNHLGVVIS